ncbi:phosphotransferase family protein [Halodurantibacterium flavum]|uniref:Phosphotransferase family protein n=1 Tax=Halodurantibacterium flavum TaxID=1382802 RepID=A0ABW4S9C0_9RHOB
MEQRVRDALIATGAVPAVCRWERLEGGRVNLLWRVQGRDVDLVVRLYRDCRNSPLFRNMPGAELATLHALTTTGLVPTAARLEGTPAGKCLIYSHIPGAPWRQGTAGVARLLGALHSLPPPPGLPHRPVSADGLLEEAAGLLPATDDPLLPELLRHRPDPDDPGPAPDPRLIHRDPVPGNIIVQGEKMSLIDWQSPGLGDPCEDLAAFLSPAMQHLYRGKVLSPAEEAEFLSAYPCRDTIDRLNRRRRIFHWRLAAHCLWRSRQGLGDYATAFALELAALRSASRATPPPR